MKIIRLLILAVVAYAPALFCSAGQPSASTAAPSAATTSSTVNTGTESDDVLFSLGNANAGGTLYDANNDALFTPRARGGTAAPQTTAGLNAGSSPLPRKMSILDGLLAQQAAQKKAASDIAAAKKNSPKKPYLYFIRDLNENKKNRETYEKLANAYIINFEEADPLTGQTPLMIAAKLNNFEIYKYILDNLKSDSTAINDQDKFGNTALHHVLIALKSIKNNNLARQAQELKKKHDAQESAKKRELDLLAKTDDKRERIRIELEKLKVDNTAQLTNFFEKNKSPNLLESMQQARTIAIDLIKRMDKIQNGQGLTLANNKGKTPFMLMSDNNDDTTLRALLINSNGLRHNYTKASLAQVRAAADSGSDADSSDEEQDSHNAKKVKEPNKAGSAAAPKQEKTIYQAVRECDYKAFQELMAEDDREVKAGKKGINLDTPENKKNKTLLILAVKNLANADAKKALEIERIVDDLINRKADLSQQEAKSGNTALHIALQYPLGEAIAHRLIEASTQEGVKIKNSEGNTPLHIIAMVKTPREDSGITIDDYIKLASELVQKGALISSKNNANKTPIDLAKEIFDKEIEGIVTANKTTAPLGISIEQLQMPKPSNKMYLFLKQLNDLKPQPAQN